MTRCAALALALVLLAGCEDRRPAVDRAAGWFPNEQTVARCIIAHESGGNVRATGSAGERGLFQIHPIHRRTFERLTGRPWADAYDPTLNGQVAKVIRDRDGWRAWSTAKGCGA